MDCSICLENFDRELKLPILLECGHTFCKTCLDDILLSQSSCPVDNSSLSTHPSQCKPNYSLLEMIDKSKDLLSNSISMQEPHITPSKPHFIYESDSVPSRTISVPCPLGHDLDYIRSMSRSLYLDNLISCFLCNSCCDGQSWHCSICMIDICTTCHMEENEARKIEAPSKLKCGRGHQMYLYTDTTLFYKRKNSGRGKIQCDYCGTAWYGRSWNCRICSYDLCTSCKEKIVSGASYLPEEAKSTLKSIAISSSFTIHFNEINDSEKSETSSHLILCPRDHSLIPSTHPYIWQCSICKISQTGFRLGCIQCHYFTCRTCNLYYTQNTYVDPPELKCPQNHRLIRSTDQEKMYRIRRGEYNYTGFCCNSCIKNCEGPSTHCRQCNFDLCDTCVGVIKRGVEKGIRIKCKAGHEILWQNDTAKFYREESSKSLICCGVCGKRIEEMGSFACKICRFDVCIKCCKSSLNS